jgi:hypothetical protein
LKAAGRTTSKKNVIRIVVAIVGVHDGRVSPWRHRSLMSGVERKVATAALGSCRSSWICAQGAEIKRQSLDARGSPSRHWQWTKGDAGNEFDASLHLVPFVLAFLVKKQSRRTQGKSLRRACVEIDYCMESSAARKMGIKITLLKELLETVLAAKQKRTKAIRLNGL